MSFSPYRHRCNPTVSFQVARKRMRKNEEGRDRRIAEFQGYMLQTAAAETQLSIKEQKKTSRPPETQPCVWQAPPSSDASSAAAAQGEQPRPLTLALNVSSSRAPSSSTPHPHGRWLRRASILLLRVAVHALHPFQPSSLLQTKYEGIHSS